MEACAGGQAAAVTVDGQGVVRRADRFAGGRMDSHAIACTLTAGGWDPLWCGTVKDRHAERKGGAMRFGVLGRHTRNQHARAVSTVGVLNIEIPSW